MHLLARLLTAAHEPASHLIGITLAAVEIGIEWAAIEKGRRSVFPEATARWWELTAFFLHEPASFMQRNGCQCPNRGDINSIDAQDLVMATLMHRYPEQNHGRQLFQCSCQFDLFLQPKLGHISKHGRVVLKRLLQAFAHGAGFTTTQRFDYAKSLRHLEGFIQVPPSAAVHYCSDQDCFIMCMPSQIRAWRVRLLRYRLS